MSENVIKKAHCFLSHNTEAHLYPNLCTFYGMDSPTLLTLQVKLLKKKKKKETEEILLRHDSQD